MERPPAPVPVAALPVTPPPEPVAVAPIPPAEPAPAETPPPEPPPTVRAEAPEEPRPAPVKAAPKSKLTFRIRPYATVFLDGKALGVTPLAPVTVTAGTHQVRLINRELRKDLARSITVKPGKDVFALDLEAP